MHDVARYEQWHPKIKNFREVVLINSFEPSICPFCNSDKFVKSILIQMKSAGINVAVEKHSNQLQELFWFT